MKLAIFIALCGSLVWLVSAFHRGSHRFAPSVPFSYGPDWRHRAQRYWREHGRFCQICNTHRRDLVVHHRYGAGNHWPIGFESDYALLGVCTKCHTRIHTKHRRLVRFGLDREPYRRLDNVTRRALWLGAWRRTLRRRSG